MATAIVRSPWAFSVLLTVLASAVHAQETPPPAYQIAAQQAGIPSAVLYAIALQESGTWLNDHLVPWPWTLNIAGRAYRYTRQAEACAGLQQALQRTSPTHVDAGLGQINLGHQQRRYQHPCELLDPYRNLAIAAAILREQHSTGQDWLITIGRYHRPAGGAPASRYRQSVSLHLARVLGDAPVAATAQGDQP